MREIYRRKHGAAQQLVNWSTDQCSCCFYRRQLLSPSDNVACFLLAACLVTPTAVASACPTCTAVAILILILLIMLRTLYPTVVALHWYFVQVVASTVDTTVCCLEQVRHGCCLEHALHCTLVLSVTCCTAVVGIRAWWYKQSVKGCMSSSLLCCGTDIAHTAPRKQ